MGTEDLILDLELISRECVIEGQQPITKPDIAVGDLVLVRDNTSVLCLNTRWVFVFSELKVIKLKSRTTTESFAGITFQILRKLT